MAPQRSQLGASAWKLANCSCRATIAACGSLLPTANRVAVAAAVATAAGFFATATPLPLVGPLEPCDPLLLPLPWGAAH